MSDRTAAARQARRKARMDAGFKLVTLELSPDDIATLCATRYLGEWDEDDKAAIVQSLYDLLAHLRRRYEANGEM